MASSGLKKMIISIISNTWLCISFHVFCNFMATYVVNYYIIQADGMPLTDVIAI